MGLLDSKLGDSKGMANASLGESSFGDADGETELFEYAFNYDGSNEYFTQENPSLKFNLLNDFTIWGVCKIDGNSDKVNTLIGNWTAGGAKGFMFNVSHFGLGMKAEMEWSNDGSNQRYIEFAPAQDTGEYLWWVAYFDQTTPNNSNVWVNGTILTPNYTSAVNGTINPVNNLIMSNNGDFYADISTAAIGVWEGDKTTLLNDLYTTMGIVYPAQIIAGNTPEFLFMAKDNSPTGSGVFRYGTSGGSFPNMEAGDKVSVDF